MAGSRPYQEGDSLHTIDWAASARLSSARQRDEFIVRERFAEEAPRVVVVSDRRPEMAFFQPPLPWLDKAEAMRQTVELDHPEHRARRRLRRLRGLRGGRGVLAAAAGWPPPMGAARGALAVGPVRCARGQRRRRGAPPHRALQGRHTGQLRVRALGLLRSTFRRRLAEGARAAPRRRAGRHPGPDVGAELPRRGRDRRAHAGPEVRADDRRAR